MKLNIEPLEFKKLLYSKDYVIIDIRCNYEDSVGYFEESIKLKINYFK